MAGSLRLRDEGQREFSAQGLYDFVRERGGGVSFVEVMRWAGDQGKGDYGLTVVPNLYLWVGLSEALLDILDELRGDKRLLLEMTSWLVYTADGGMLRWPIPKRIPKAGFKKEHWLPVVMWTDEQHAGLNSRKGGKKR